MKKHFFNVPNWSIDKWFSVLAEIPVCSCNPRIFKKYNQTCLVRKCYVTKGFQEHIYHVGNGKELRSIVSHGILGGISPKQADKVCFTVLKSDG